MRNVCCVVALLFALAGAGCSSQDATQLFETAQFEELQNNREHARQLYEEIIKKHPESAYAKQARERLEALK